MRPIVYVSPFVARWFVSILIIIPVVRWCSLIGPHWSPVLLFDLSLLMLWGWGLIWIASLTLRVYQWGSQSINLTLLQIAPPHRLMKTSSIEVETSRSTSKVNISWDKRIKFISFLIPRWTITTCTYFVKESDPRSNVHYLSSSSFFFFSGLIFATAQVVHNTARITFILSFTSLSAVQIYDFHIFLAVWTYFIARL